MKVKICGITHEVIECEDAFDVDLHFGMIDFKKSLIKINSDLSEEAKRETMCHEIVHGILVHLGYNNLNEDETFVQSLGNAINQTFDIRGVE